MADENFTALTADIVASYVAQNRVSLEALTDLIGNVYSTLSTIGSGPEPVAAERQKPAVPIKKSITPEFLISLEDGRKYKSLKRHLRTAHNMSPEDYRAKWGLNADYPMVAPAYSASRSSMAKSMGLGRGGAIRPATASAKAPAKRAAKAKV
jgi:predicted transcriptional regulator